MAAAIDYAFRFIGVHDGSGYDLLENGAVRRLVLFGHSFLDVVHLRTKHSNAENSGHVFSYFLV